MPTAAALLWSEVSALPISSRLSCRSNESMLAEAPTVKVPSLEIASLPLPPTIPEASARAVREVSVVEATSASVSAMESALIEEVA